MRRLAETISMRVVMLLGAGIFFAFAFWALKYRHEYSMKLYTERVVGCADNKWQNILVLLAFWGISLLLTRIVLRGDALKVRRRVRMIVIGYCVLLGIVLVIWVSICHIEPVWDQFQVFQGAEAFHSGDFDLMDTYYDTYPHQYGLTFIYELFIGVSESIKLYQYINVLFIVTIDYFIYLVTDELFHSEEINLYVLIGIASFWPLPLYVNFVYGELWNMTFGMIAFWGILRRLSTGKWQYSILSLFAMSIAMVARKNVIVWAIAIMLMLLVYAFRHANMRLCVLGMLMVAIPWLALELVLLSYEVRSGKEIGVGSPNITTVAMGLQDGWTGAGHYNAYNSMVYINDANRDEKLAAKLAWEEIGRRMEVFVADPGYARDFFQRKIWQQWNEGTFNSLIMTCTFEQEPEGIVESVYYGSMEKAIFAWGNYFLFIMYFFVFVYALRGLLREKRIEKGLPMIAIIGGVLFSLIWESKARYMFPYTVLILPCMAAGMYEVRALACSVGDGFKEKLRKGVLNGKTKKGIDMVS